MVEEVASVAAFDRLVTSSGVGKEFEGVVGECDEGVVEGGIDGASDGTLN